jgi:uncharacterized protein (DUF1015 family)
VPLFAFLKGVGMAIVKPFQGIRPASHLVSEVAALPYDVYNREEALEEVKKHPFSFLAIDRPETQFPKEQDMYAPCVYQKAAQMLSRQIEEGIYITDETKCYYIYMLTMNGRSQTGLVALSSIDDYQNQVIKKHENTRKEKEQDRICHVDICNAQTGPIFLAYRKVDKIQKMIEEQKKSSPIFDFISEDGIGHTGWKIEDEKVIQNLEEAFAKIPNTYIADGHHRAASAVKVGLKRRQEHPDYTGKEEFNFFLSVLFPDSELQILPYNRVVSHLNGKTNEEFLQEVAKKFEVEKSDKAVEPVKKGTFGMLLEHQWYLLTAKKEILSNHAVKGLDVSILQNELLNPILGIKDARTDETIEFIGGIRGVKELEKRCNEDMKVAFSMYPTSISELLKVADCNLLMPPKSTWFEPKLRSGLFIHSLKESD